MCCCFLGEVSPRVLSNKDVNKQDGFYLFLNKSVGKMNTHIVKLCAPCNVFIKYILILKDTSK